MTRKKLFNCITRTGLLFVLLTFINSCKKSDNTVIKPVDVPTQPAKPVTYVMVWSDEFNGSSIDTNNWNVETGNPGVNHEEEYYRSTGLEVANGNLVITARKQPFGVFPYTSGRINSMNKIDGTYGRIEARIKMPMSTGLWPAFWCLGADVNTVPWPACGEIDIMEHINSLNTIFGNMQWNRSGLVQYGNTSVTTPDQYHLYAIEWDENSIRWYVDSTLYLTANIANNINGTAAFHLPFFIVLNMAVGGDLPGLTVDETALPASMYVDYVRIYAAAP